MRLIEKIISPTYQLFDRLMAEKPPKEPNKDLPLDHCIRCGIQLLDRKAITKFTHDQAMHKPTRKQLAMRFLRAWGLVAFVCGMLFIAIPAMVLLPNKSDFDEAYQQCAKDINNIETMLKQNKFKTNQTMTEFYDSLDEKCRRSIELGSYWTAYRDKTPDELWVDRQLVKLGKLFDEIKDFFKQ